MKWSRRTIDAKAVQSARWEHVLDREGEESLLLTFERPTEGNIEVVISEAKLPECLKLLGALVEGREAPAMDFEPRYHEELFHLFHAAADELASKTGLFDDVVRRVLELPPPELAAFIMELAYGSSDQRKALFRIGLLIGTMWHLSSQEGGVTGWLRICVPRAND